MQTSQMKTGALYVATAGKEDTVLSGEGSCLLGLSQMLFTGTPGQDDAPHFEPTPVSSQQGFRGKVNVFLSLGLHCAAAACVMIPAIAHIRDNDVHTTEIALSKFVEQLSWTLTIAPPIAVVLTLIFYLFCRHAMASTFLATLLGGTFFIIQGAAVTLQVLMIQDIPGGRSGEFDETLVAGFYLYCFVVANYVFQPICGIYHGTVMGYNKARLLV